MAKGRGSVFYTEAAWVGGLVGSDYSSCWEDKRHGWEIRCWICHGSPLQWFLRLWIIRLAIYHHQTINLIWKNLSCVRRNHEEKTALGFTALFILVLYIPIPFKDSEFNDLGLAGTLNGPFWSSFKPCLLSVNYVDVVEIHYQKNLYQNINFFSFFLWYSLFLKLFWFFFLLLPNLFLWIFLH